jgi:hypothetical protein
MFYSHDDEGWENEGVVAVAHLAGSPIVPYSPPGGHIPVTLRF